jgi:hypothetical protein
MTQEQIVDNIILDELELKHPGSKELILSKTTKSGRRMAMLSIMDDDRKLFEQYKNIIKSEEVCGNYAKEVIQILREYVKVADTEVKEHGEVMTPLTLVNEMLDKLPSEVWVNPNLKWLDPCNGVGTFPSVVVERLMIGLKDVIIDDCERYRHIIEKMIYVCEIQAKNMLIFHCSFDREDDHELNTYYGSFLDKGFDEHMLNVWGVDKFDIVLGNPPYKSGTHNKFLVKGFDFLNQNGISLILHPSTLFLSRKSVKKDKIEKRCLEIIQDNECSLELIDGFKHFENTGFYVPLSITYVVKTNNPQIEIFYNYLIGNQNRIVKVNNLDSVFLHGNDLVYNISQKVFSKMESSVEDNLFRNGKVSNYYLAINGVSGAAPRKGKIGFDFYCFFTKKFENELTSFISTTGIPIIDKAHTNQIGLNSHQECLNMTNTLMTKFMRFCLSFYKIGIYMTRGELKSVPFMDATIEWTDEMLFEYFELTNQEIKFINTFIGDWYVRDFDKYNEEYHTSKSTDETKNCWNKLKDEIMKLDNVEIDYGKKNYVSFFNDEDEVICKVKINKDYIRFLIYRGNISEDGKESKCMLHITDDRNLMTIIEQSFDTIRTNGTKQKGKITFYSTDLVESFDAEYLNNLIKQKYIHLKNN